MFPAIQVGREGKGEGERKGEQGGHQDWTPLYMLLHTCCSLHAYPVIQEGQHPLTRQRAANFRLLANQ